MSGESRVGGRPPLDESTRERTRELARGDLARNAVAREVGVSARTVSRICAEAVSPITFDRPQTAAATQARAIDLRAERARIAERALSKANDLLDLTDAPHELTHWGKDGVLYRAIVNKPTAADVQRYLIGFGVVMDKHLLLVRHDSDDRALSSVGKWIANLMGGDTPEIQTRIAGRG